MRTMRRAVRERQDESFSMAIHVIDGTMLQLEFFTAERTGVIPGWC